MALVAKAPRGQAGTGSLSASEKQAKKTYGAIARQLMGGDLADIREDFRIRQQVLEVLDQTGPSEGKRFNGAENHTPEANAAALVETVTRGMIPKIV